MKKTQSMIIFVFLLFIGITKVNAQAIDASIELVGRNTFGRELEIEVDCRDAGDSECYITDAKWYYNNTNSTNGGTLIVGTESGGTGYKNYYIEEDLVGKYIYVVATISSYDNDYEEITLTEITDADTNVTATVDNYIDYVDNSSYFINASATFEVGASLTLTLDGYTEKENESVFVYLTNDESVPLTETESGCTYPEISSEDYTKFKSVYNNKITVSADWFLLKGYTKAYVVKYINDKDNGGFYCEVNKDAINITKPSIPTLGSRYQFYLFTNDNSDKSLSTFPLFPYDGITGSHKLITKIGIINDNSLLKKLSKNTKGSLEELLTYAKSNNGTTFKYSDEHYYDNDIGSFSVTDGAYYYVYTTYENSDGLYRDFDDVTVVMGVNGMLSNDVKWTSSNTSTIWEDFVSNVKNNELLKDNEDIKITDDEDSLELITANQTKKITLTFNYNNGIVSFEVDKSLVEEDLFVVSLYQSIIIEEFLEMFHYDKEKSSKYLEDNPNLTIDKDGFEYILKNIKYVDDNGEIVGDVLTSFKFDLINGLKNYQENNNQYLDTPLENPPQTGLYYGIAILSSLLIIGLITYKKIRKHNKLIRL